MNKIFLVGAGIACAAAAFAPLANAYPDYVKMRWGTRCAVDVDQVACETCVMGTHFCDPPGSVMTFDTLGVVAPGSVADDLGPAPGTPVSDQPVHVNGWTVVMDGDWARFTNDGTGHGVAVAPQNFYSF